MFSSELLASRGFYLCLVFLTYMFVAAMVGHVSAETASDLLEQAIYAEETVGDLEKAIEAYEKVLAESADSIGAAAEAQYRIGVCYQKQGKAELAAEAFAAVVENYPGAGEWVTKAKKHAPGSPELLPVPWGDGDELHFEMKLATGMSVGHQVFRVAKVEQAGKPYWECSNWQTVAINDLHGKSRVLADFDTFAPIESEWKHSLLGGAAAKYHEDHVTIDMVNKDEPITLAYERPVYDNEQAAETFRRLPLKKGYKAELTITPILTGTVLPLAISVPAIESITTPVGTFECFRVELTTLGQTFWISNDEHRYIVRFAAGGVTADLFKVSPPRKNQPTQVDHERVKFTLPPDWHAYTPTGDDDSEKTRMLLIDPQAEVDSRMLAAPLERVAVEHEGPVEWLEWGLSDNHKTMANFAIDDRGVQATTVGGREAADAFYEFTDRGTRKRAWRIVAYGEHSAFDVRFVAAKEEFDALKPAFEEILGTVKID